MMGPWLGLYVAEARRRGVAPAVLTGTTRVQELAYALAVYTPKDFQLVQIMADLAELVARQPIY